MKFINMKKIKGLLFLELENSAQFPIIEIFILFLNFIILESFFGGNSQNPLLPGIPYPSIRGLFINNIAGSINLYLFVNGLFLCFLYNNSLSNDKEKLFRPTLLSYPVSKSVYLTTKVSFYFVINFAITFFLIVLYNLNASYGFDLSIVMIVFLIVFLNQLFATFVSLLVFIFIQNFTISNLFIFGIWLIKLIAGQSVSTDNTSTNFITGFLFPNYLFSEFLDNDLLMIVSQIFFGLVLTAITFVIVLQIFKQKEISRSDV